VLHAATCCHLEQTVALLISQPVDVDGVLVFLDADALGDIGADPTPVDRGAERHLQDGDAFSDGAVAQRLAQRIRVALHVKTAQVLEAGAFEGFSVSPRVTFVFEPRAGFFL
jgi:hypothetical protein